MDRMWSPWRSDYITDHTNRHSPPEGKGSVFTRILNAADDQNNFVLYRAATCFVTMNRYPYNNGHLLVVPNREVPSLTALSPAERAELFETVNRCVEILEKTMSAEGINVGINQGAAAGAGIPGHLHVHVLPRWSGDTSFTSTIADTRVIPQAMATTWQILSKEFRASQE